MSAEYAGMMWDDRAPEIDGGVQMIKFAKCSTCGHKSTGWTYGEALDNHSAHTRREHPSDESPTWAECSESNEPWHVNYGGKKSIREAMLDVNEAFKALAGVFLDEATRLLNKMTDWLNARYKK